MAEEQPCPFHPQCGDHAQSIECRGRGDGALMGKFTFVRLGNRSIRAVQQKVKPGTRHCSCSSVN